MKQLEPSSMEKTLVKIPLYRAQLLVYYGNYDELNKVNIQYGFDELNKTTEGRAIWNSRTNRFALLFRNDVKIKTGGIVHECKHMVNFIFNARGIELDIDNDEPECYLLQWLVDKIYSIMKTK